MNRILLTTMVMAFAIANLAQAATVNSAKLDASKKNLIVSVSYGGGCSEHKFSLKLKGCAESFPAQCKADLIEKTTDTCEAFLTQDVVLNLKEAGIQGDYYSKASLTIFGDQRSQATVYLPEFSNGNPDVPAPRAGIVECITHTGSILTINPSTKRISIETTAGKKESYGITKTDSITLESNPPIDQTTYSMDDTRKVVTSFRGSEKTGSGYFIRVTGEASPEFRSCKR